MTIGSENAAAPQKFNPFAGPEITLTAPSLEPQREIWSAIQADPDVSCAFNESLTVRFEGRLDREALERALGLVVERHEALRAVFSSNGALLLVTPSAAVPFAYVDLRDGRREESERRRRELKELESSTPFDLLNGPLVRARLVRCEEELHELLITFHHIIADGWSIDVALGDLARAYNALVAGRCWEDEPATQISQYAEDEETYRGSEAYAHAESYWLSQFESIPAPLDLPHDLPRPAIRTHSSQLLEADLPLELIEALKAVGAKRGSSLHATLMAAFQLYLARVSATDDVVVGMPTAGQPAAGHLDLVGHLVHLLPFRTRIDASQPFVHLLEATRSRLLDAYDHQRFSYGSLLKKLRVARDASRPPLVSVTFNIDVPRKHDFQGLRTTVRTNAFTKKNFELSLNCVQGADRFLIECQYSSDLFTEGRAKGLLSGFRTLLEGIAEDPETACGALPLLSKEERKRILEGFNPGPTPFSKEASIIDLIEKAASKDSDKTALACGNESRSYLELVRNARRIGAAVRGLGGGVGQVVGVCMTRSIAMVETILGVLHSGAAYLPIDPELSSERTAFMLKDSNALFALADADSLFALDDAELPVYLASSDGLESEEGDPVDVGDGELPPLTGDAVRDMAAYLIYTSGTTGQPKGVFISHRSVVNFLEGIRSSLGSVEDDRCLAATSISFDVSVQDLLYPLTVGATVTLAAAEEAADGEALGKLIDRDGVTVIASTPSRVRLLLDAGWKGREGIKLFLAGEALSRDLVEKLLALGMRVWNNYGPTEATVLATFAEITDPRAPITIGRPLPNYRTYVLDERGERAPVWVVGELFIGGEGVGLGYHNRPELTAERFVLDPFGAPGGRMYKTGDLVRWREDGTIEYLGRNDSQLKVRGFRIEAGEIEALLNKLEGLTESVVVVIEPTKGDQRLTACYSHAPDADFTNSEVRRHLRKRLPDYMIPQILLPVEKLPRTGTGKVDRKAVAAIAQHSLAGIRKETTPPRTDAERLVAEIWMRALGVDAVNVHDNFFAVGGHSLLAVRVISDIAKRTGKKFSPQLLISDTLEQFAARLETGDGGRVAVHG